MSAPAARTHLDTDVWHSGDIVLTFIWPGIGEMSSNRSVGNSCSAYHQNRRSMICLKVRFVGSVSS
jgi:hypothetical protein